jgi:hypothetical protein
MSDKDSLFGSPPPSPSARGRSPSLALPESSGWRLEDAQTNSQNVGTIALPGSQSHSSELPVFLTPALPSENNVLQLRPPAQRAQAPLRRQNTNHTARSAPHMDSSAHHTARTDQTLRDLVGLISHFEPVATASSSRQPPITVPSPQATQNLGFYPPGSAQNPIEIDTPGPADAVNSALIALAGTVASALKVPTAPREPTSLSEPTFNNVLHCIKHDPKLIPALKATYEYLGSIPNNSQTPPRSFPHVPTNQPDSTSGNTKKRKRKYSGPQVPAGAGHWNVPFPFAPGKEPSGYPSQWHLERGRRVLGDLLGLFERAFAKARGEKRAKTVKAPSQQPTKKQRTHAVTSAPVRDAEGSVAGKSDQGTIPVAIAKSGGLDYERMTDWLSSVPSLPSSSIMDSINFPDTPSPSTSDPSPLQSEPLLDFMAMLGPNVPDAPKPSVGDMVPDFGFEGAFDDLDAGLAGGDITWQSILGSDPASQSINDLAASASDIQSSRTHPGTDELVLDPSLASSQHHAIQPSPGDSQSLQLSPVPASLSKECQDPATQAAASDVFALLKDGGESLCQQSCSQSVATEVEPDIDVGESAFLSSPFIDAFIAQYPPVHAAQSVDTHSLLTIPTASGSSSLCGPTPSSRASGSMSPAPSAIAGSSVSGPPTKVERKAAALAKAQEHRDRLIKELQRTQVQRWELLIEGGVLRNLEKAGAQ